MRSLTADLHRAPGRAGLCGPPYRHGCARHLPLTGPPAAPALGLGSQARGTAREAMSEVPAGFEPSRRTSPFLDMIGPVYTMTGERGILLGLRARTQHLNTRGCVHGAILAALLDVVCGRNCGAQTEHPSLVTVSLT